MFLKNKNIIFKIRRSKVTDYAALTLYTAYRYCVNIPIYIHIQSYGDDRSRIVVQVNGFYVFEFSYSYFFITVFTH